VVVIPPGAEPEFLVPQPRPFPGTSPFHLIHVANLTEVKDQETLLRAYAEINRTCKAELRIVGGDYLAGRIQRRARELGLSEGVSFTGFVPHEAMPEQFAWAHVLLQTSLHEAGGVAVAEAAAARVVIAGSATGLLADLADRCAVAIAPADSNALARAVCGLLAEPVRFMNLQEQAFQWARDNSVETSARLIAETYDKLVD
jgi:glycosyltransferase involved in cell wall biosynthesis